ncbi:hypothetical protein BDQ17DRAFT_673621 [Cyathus striatus]|nr:hypothetical protein BDQ17DRAFT_673621 [Cyathus striatus]
MLNASSSPTRILFPELISKIFIHCFYEDIFDAIPVQDDPQRPPQPPLYLAQICRHWRSIALSIPWLWSEIPLLSNAPDNSKKKNVAFLKGYLKRSNVYPLSIYLMLNPDYISRRRVLNSAPILSALIENSHRWKKASITTDFEVFCQFNQISLPALEQLHLLFDGFGRGMCCY